MESRFDAGLHLRFAWITVFHADFLWLKLFEERLVGPCGKEGGHSDLCSMLGERSLFLFSHQIQNVGGDVLEARKGSRGMRERHSQPA